MFVLLEAPSSSPFRCGLNDSLIFSNIKLKRPIMYSSSRRASLRSGWSPLLNVLVLTIIEWS